MLTVQHKDPVKTGQVDPWLRQQCRQVGNEIRRLKDHVHVAVPGRCLELETDVAIQAE